jgi:hypothetical protein
MRPRNKQRAAQAAETEPQADKIFRTMTDYVSELKQFSAQAKNTIEIVTITWCM